MLLLGQISNYITYFRYNIIFWQSSAAQSNNTPKKCWRRRQICCSGMTEICLEKSIANTLWLQLKKNKNRPLKYLLKRERKNKSPFEIPLQKHRGGVLEGSIWNSSSTKDMGNQGKKYSTETTAQQLEKAVDSKVKINIKKTCNMLSPPIIPIEDLRNVIHG